MPQRSFIAEVSTVAGPAATGFGMGSTLGGATLGGAIIGGTITGGTTGATTMPRRAGRV
ncbi:MAG: hypothetical protein P0Y50_01785 [Candidatus Brevundimonas colombiensis]|uniref:Uncharacterized protein n=1 Tax=Candidatus Brevundimonas colombiensis TaxID=3121376 RepID=A0AAJ5WXW9_9CAUL|nr:hypothetical protein [Brevundimonas sp.]WEK40361.1 MAG: hypothetical protein P0Y50_01785 [Brevundimonas sp.]